MYLPEAIVRSIARSWRQVSVHEGVLRWRLPKLPQVPLPSCTVFGDETGLLLGLRIVSGKRVRKARKRGRSGLQHCRSNYIDLVKDFRHNTWSVHYNRYECGMQPCKDYCYPYLRSKCSVFLQP